MPTCPYCQEALGGWTVYCPYCGARLGKPPGLVKTRTLDGRSVEFVDAVLASNEALELYASPDRSCTVELFRAKPSPGAKERLILLTGRLRADLFEQAQGEYWNSLFCWPDGVVEANGRLGATAPARPTHFRFEFGGADNDALKLKGQEKTAEWFADAHRYNRLDARERGDWLTTLRLCILLARALRRLHAAGWRHGALSARNLLLDPPHGRACLLGIAEGLSAPGAECPQARYEPGFAAPEILAARAAPSLAADRHALAVTIYLLLLHRHPLRGGETHDQPSEKAIFAEHPGAPAPAQPDPESLPWADTAKRPYTLVGPYLSALFKRAFVDGLYAPDKRPAAEEWEQALVKTVDLTQPCANPQCQEQWYVFDNAAAPRCPFCGAPHQGPLPIFNLYSRREDGRYRPDNHRLMIYHNQSLFPWHVERDLFPNESLNAELRKRVGYFLFHDQAWHLVNERLPQLMDVTADTKRLVPPGESIKIQDGQKLLLSREEGGRLVVVQMVNPQGK
jgi:hypothetical protein